ncbi:type I restriction endonuclease subunit R [Candidatus Uabimicrobium sp. HlEnr_7]|uniref:type I restriction endonuclease subunit R n=1 Tax=Candidatus Uabimicrobium helgolandensis TaxID=3095367 RepID=UPI003558FEE1
MVLLGKWILENKPHARIVVITDRDELDKQIEKVFKDAKQQIYRSSSGNDLIAKLHNPKFRLICSLVHKFGRKDVKNFERFIKQLKQQPPIVAGDLFVFVDECHRTQSGKLHRTMKAMLPQSTFIGFTGTPLLQEDKKTSMEVFGKYIHTYKFHEGVADGIILDLVYEARDIDQIITSHSSIDSWFDRKTRALNDFQRAQLRQRWATIQKVLSSRSRMERIVDDIVLDFATKTRLSSDSGNAILVASSIYEACRYHELFLQTTLAAQCAIVTSYNPSAKDIKTEDSGSETERQFMYDHYRKILNGKSTENHEDEAKRKFCNEPQNMKLLIVVSKLLTGFDAPSCTYLYIDKNMRDHGLFQAICRVNRLDGEDKDFGYIVDYKNLFASVQDAMFVYTSPLDCENFEREDIDIMLQDGLQANRENLEVARNAIFLLCEPISSPTSEDYRHYFCGNPEIAEDLKETEVRRSALYQHVVTLTRAYVNIADSITEAGYSNTQIEEIKQEVDFYVKVRAEIRAVSGKTLDLRAYEADMRHLIDNYISASEPRPISNFGGMSLLEIITIANISAAIDSLPPSIHGDNNAIAETIENNIRRCIINESATDPVFFDRISRLLIEIINQRRENAIAHEEYLQRIAQLARQVQTRNSENIPRSLTTAGQRALFNNLERNEQLAIEIDSAVKKVKKDDWRGNQAKE